MYSTKKKTRRVSPSFADDFSNFTKKRTCPLRIAILIFVLWLASSAAFGTLFSIWQSSRGMYEVIQVNSLRLTYNYQRILPQKVVSANTMTGGVNLSRVR